MESTRKESVLSKIINGIKKGWERLGVPDINVYEDTEEVRRIEKVQAEIHKQGDFVLKVPVNEKEAQKTAEQRSNGSKRKSKVLGEQQK